MKFSDFRFLIQYRIFLDVIKWKIKRNFTIELNENKYFDKDIFDI
jgi:hypothetical protein